MGSNTGNNHRCKLEYGFFDIHRFLELGPIRVAHILEYHHSEHKP